MDTDVQTDEITALQNIYQDEEFSYQRDKDGRYQCIFQICIALPKTYYLDYKDVTQQQEEFQKVEISHLPPLTLEVVLPEDYPQSSAPEFKLKCCWLTPVELSKLCKKLDELWEQNGDQILYIWVDFLMQDTLAFLNIVECLRIEYIGKQAMKALKAKEEERSQNSEKRKSSVHKSYDPRAIWDSSIEDGKNPIQFLINYNKKRHQLEFKKNVYECKICFSDKPGEQCMQFLPCNHIYCKACIADYLEVRINDGNVQNIYCPEEGCTSEVKPSQVKDLISLDLYNKYDSILLNTTLDTMPDIMYCPRRFCQYPVSVEQNGPRGLGQCPSCCFAFCIYCKMAYHALAPCRMLFDTEERQSLVNEYQNASCERKQQLEQIYGRKNLENLIETTMSESWISNNTSQCPCCNAAIEKSQGCNKMTCSKCRTFFCWLCHEILNSQNPYKHYSDPNSKCFNMLNHRIIEDDEEEFGFHIVNPFEFY